MAIGVIGIIGGVLGWQLRDGSLPTLSQWFSNDLVSPFIAQENTPLPLLAYSIPTLAGQSIEAESALTIEQALPSTSETFTSYLFSYQSNGKKITGQLNIPTTPAPTTGYPVILMLRGYVPPESYQTGVGTKNAAAKLAEQGYVTLAPDFLGFGGSDPEPEDTWEARFIKPITVIDLLASVETHPAIAPSNVTSEVTTAPVKLDPTKIGIWAHSNGGQIALTVLEITGRKIPTTLWAPVTVPFPYSILFFGDEIEDEGKSQRAWLALFEQKYDVFDFTLTKHLDLLAGNQLQLHHGTADDAALIAWSDEFMTKIDAENQRRAEVAKLEATKSANLASTPTPQTERSANQEPIEITYFTYPGADHNLNPAWNTVIARDISFFNTQLGVSNPNSN